MFTYLVSGLGVASELALPGLIALESGQREFEVSPEDCVAEVGSFLAEREQHGAVAIDRA